MAVVPFLNQDPFTIALNNPPDRETGPEFVARLGIDSGIAEGHKALIHFDHLQFNLAVPRSQAENTSSSDVLGLFRASQPSVKGRSRAIF
jgi:hypothetical protein